MVQACVATDKNERRSTESSGSRRLPPRGHDSSEPRPSVKLAQRMLGRATARPRLDLYESVMKPGVGEDALDWTDCWVGNGGPGIVGGGASRDRCDAHDEMCQTDRLEMEWPMCAYCAA